jgi:PD-(D/E)XK nuclease superfamily protein
MPDEIREIHTSERKSFRACRRRWDWLFREGYRPIQPIKPLEFGIAYHRALEIWYDPDLWDKGDREILMSHTIQTFKATCREQKERYLEEKDASVLEEDVEADYAERVRLGVGMLRYYCQEISPKYDIHWRPIAVELEFSVPIRYPNTGVHLQDTTGRKVNYAGRVDLLVEDDKGGLWVFDHKTAARLNTDNDEFLYLDDQITSYCWALKQLGYPIRGFIYSEIKKGFPEPPTQNIVPRQGRWFSVNRQQNTDYDTYLKTVQEHDTQAYEAGYYDEFLEFLKTEGIQFHQRYQIHRSDIELQNAGNMILLEAEDMIDDCLRIYPNAGRFGCNTCAFRQPCLGKNNGEDYEYTLKTMYKHDDPYAWTKRSNK